MRTHGKLPVTIRRIILTGFMGAGKSTVGSLLAQRLGWQFVDTDQVIEAQTGLTIARLFAEHGEETFRALEAEAVHDKVQAEDVVLALGGGAIEVEGTREALLKLKEACVIFLDAPLEVMVARCLAQRGAAERPVLRDRDGLTARLAARLPHYRQAHLIVATADLTPEAAAEAIFAVLQDSMSGHAAGQDLRKENLTHR